MGILEGRALEECEGGDEEEQSGQRRYGTRAGGEGEDHVRGKRDILSCSKLPFHQNLTVVTRESK